MSPRVTLWVLDETISPNVYFPAYISFYFQCHWILFAFWALYIVHSCDKVFIMSIADTLVIYMTRPVEVPLPSLHFITSIPTEPPAVKIIKSVEKCHWSRAVR